MMTSEDLPSTSQPEWLEPPAGVAPGCSLEDRSVAQLALEGGEEALSPWH
jgi:hypothetical protein